MEVIVRAGTRRSSDHSINQDRVVVAETVFSDVRDVSERLDGPTLVAVLDGLGGHRAGEVASQIVGEQLAKAEVPTDESTTTALLQRADEALHEAAHRDPSHAGMGTTAALLALDADGRGALVANVGDSSIWKLGDDGLVELSVSDRAFGSTILQCLGANNHGIEPHVRRIEVHAGDRLLLASDGLTDVVSSDAIEQLLRDDPAHAVERLIETVERAGPPDDVTVVLVEVVA